MHKCNECHLIQNKYITRRERPNPLLYCINRGKSAEAINVHFMNRGEIPDSDVEIPPLTPQSPHWVLLGTGRAQTESSNVQAIRDRSSHGTGVVSSLSTNLHQSKPQVTTTESKLNSGTVRDSEIAGSVHLEKETARELSAEAETTTTETQSNVPRRRRFDFKSYVERDKKMHEYVYQRRFRDYHGPMSDSEDDDFDIDETQLGHEDPSRDIDEDLFQSTSDTNSEYHDVPENDDIHATVSPYGSMGRGKHKRIIESDSESDNDAPVHSVERRLKSAIPAAPRDQPQSFESLESLEFPGMEQVDNVDLYAEATEDHRIIDYMQPKANTRGKAFTAPGNRTSFEAYSNPKGLNVLELREHAGNRASPMLRIAARTARSHKSTTFRQKHSPTTTRSSSGSLSSYFSNSKSSKSKNNAGLPAKLFLNQSDETMRVLRRLTRGDSSYDQVVPSEPSGSNSRKRPNNTRAPSKTHREKQRKLSRNTPQEFRTSIIEHQIENFRGLEVFKFSKKPENRQNTTRKISSDVSNPSTNNHSHSIQDTAVSASLSTNEKKAKDASMSPKQKKRRKKIRNAISTSMVQVKVTSPSRRVMTSFFNGDTFIGSHILHVFEEPGTWSAGDAVPTAFKFGRHICDADEDNVLSDCTTILSLAETSDFGFFSDLYSYFLASSGFLIDEREIIELEFKKLVAHAWMRLGRELLKLSSKALSVAKKRSHARRNEKGYWILQVTLLVVEASSIVSHHVGAYENSIRKKCNILSMWTLFYSQNHISSMIDRNNMRSLDRNFIGAELLLTAHKFRIYDDTVNKILNHAQPSMQKPEPYLHFIVLLTSCYYSNPSDHNSQGPWVDWTQVRNLVSGVIHVDPFLVMSYVHRLLVYWRWPVSSDIIIDLFGYFSKIRYYADPKGETIGSPRFLLDSNFDGSFVPDQSFSSFSELLGFTLKTLRWRSRSLVSEESKKAVIIMRRLASRVTPMSTLVFPQDKEITLSDSSSASHQYGLLIVLLRVLDKSMIPPIAQFRDLVVLKNSHWAMRIKAISAWDIIVRSSVTSQDYAECRNWMLEISDGGTYVEPVVSFALDKVLDYWRPEAVPSSRMAELGLDSAIQETRKKAWRSVSLAKLGTMELLCICDWKIHFSVTIDLPAIARILGQKYKEQNLSHRWVAEQCSKGNTKSRFLYTTLFNEGLSRDFHDPQLASGSIESALVPEPTEDDFKSSKASKLVPSNNSLLSQQHMSLIERRNLLRVLVKYMSNSEDACREALSKAENWSRRLIEENSASTKAFVTTLYFPLLSELRRLILPLFPKLVRNLPSSEFLDEHSKALETMESNLLSLADPSMNNIACYYYFIYRVRRLLPYDFSQTGSLPTMKYDSINDSEYLDELHGALQTNVDPLKEKQVTEALLKVYQTIIDLATEAVSHTRKTCFPLVSPTILSSARLVVTWKHSFAQQLGDSIFYASRYLEVLIERTPELLWNSFTIRFIEEMSHLGIKWLNQASVLYRQQSGHRSQRNKLPNPFRFINETLHKLYERIESRDTGAWRLDRNSNSTVNLKDHSMQILDGALRENLIMAFKTDSVIEDRVQQKSLSTTGYFTWLKRFKDCLEEFALAYDTAATKWNLSEQS